jgi:hypothetical protein
MTTGSIPLATLQETVARAIEKYPTEKGRIERAAALIVTGHVDQISPDAFAVRSQTDERVYIVDNGGCPCVDATRHPELVCKHRWAITLLLVAQERTQRLAERATAPQPVAEDGRAYLARLIAERAERARIVYATGNRPIDDDRCNALDEHIARLRANQTPATFRETVAA